MTDSQANVAEFLLSEKDPERTALLFVHDQYSYGELQRQVEQVGRAVRAIDGRKGDRMVASLLHAHLRVRGSLVIEPRFMYTETVLQRMFDTAWAEC